MKALLAGLILFTAVFHSDGLKCFTCVARNQDECNRQGSSVCPANADACATITGAHTVLKSCVYKSFCDTSSVSGRELQCCFGDECNGPHRSHSHAEHGAAAGLRSSPALLLWLALLTLAVRLL